MPAWTQAELDFLREKVTEGLTFAKIADAAEANGWSRTRNAWLGKAYRLGLIGEKSSSGRSTRSAKPKKRWQSPNMSRSQYRQIIAKGRETTGATVDEERRAKFVAQGERENRRIAERHRQPAADTLPRASELHTGCIWIMGTGSDGAERCCGAPRMQSRRTHFCAEHYGPDASGARAYRPGNDLETLAKWLDGGGLRPVRRAYLNDAQTRYHNDRFRRGRS